MTNTRGQWGSRLGFILAAAGSAVGLGNLWKFPYKAGINGGGAFVIIYIAVLFLVGFSLMIAEIAIGRKTQLNALGAYRAINKNWGFAGAIGILAGFIILSFYAVIGGWVIKYLFDSVSGSLFKINAVDYGGHFGSFISSAGSPLFYQALFMVLTLVIVLGGVSSGIEKASKIMMPALFFMMIVLMIRSVTLPGAIEGVKFLFKPDFGKAFTPKVIVDAMGQVFFSLSLGMGCMITYGSYLPRNTNIPFSGTMILILDSFVALLAGLVILPAVFSFGFEPGAGPGLMFITIPAIFSKMAFGNIFAIIFFLLVLFAALTSSISLLEVCVSYVVDEFKKNRIISSVILSIIIFLLGIPSSLANGAWSDFKILGYNFFDFMDMFASNILLPLGGLLLCIFVGWVWKTKNAVHEIQNEGSLKFSIAPLWSFIIKFISPIIIIVIFLTNFGIIKL
ncbi:sodium-dependent transporter [Oceanirhabdus seepicola]|uniref:Transporter n=1 Tax=Oceanirhabdus seepicola TaxID=2828781 RepID=A0A9J6P7I9_9CLOT|nr:sodium-dependent transporter [Oceanirhabdus seepicola]MCM1992611.1 sodium-dependent transporter [Oceanirhabdus seepicola]